MAEDQRNYKLYDEIMEEISALMKECCRNSLKEARYNVDVSIDM